MSKLAKVILRGGTPIVLMTIAVLFTYNIASAGIEFIPKEGKLWVKAAGELVILKSSPSKQEHFALKLEDERLYILIGEHSQGLKNLAGKRIEVNGLLKARIAFADKTLPSIEVKGVKEIK